MIIIVGKGPSLDKYLPIIKGDNILVACNGTINILTDPDYFALNDFETLLECDGDKIQAVPNLICPLYPHINLKSCKMFNYHHLVNMAGYKGNVYPYNIHTGFDNFENCPELNEVWNIADTVLAYFLVMNNKEFHCYGIGVDPGYAEAFGQANDSETMEWLVMGKRMMEERAKIYGAKLFFHV